ncbi:hypothetical protein LCGC14_3014760 [marine sediment metagenome]|uniref:HTH cro/C1-type domain-containing protein n=1 Tax=marine sediment metagenome TaxID=412755 RepID=A0A0F8WXN7_9ZZZZ
MIDTPLRKIRKERNKSLEQVAESVGIHPANLSRIERGIQSASKDLAENLSIYYGQAITEIEILYPERFAA